MKAHEPGEKIYRTKYKLNKNQIFEDFELKNDIFIEEKYLYGTFDKKDELIKKQKTIQRKIKGLSEKKKKKKNKKQRYNKKKNKSIQ